MKSEGVLLKRFCVVVAAVIEGQYPGIFVDSYLIPTSGIGGELGARR